MLVNENTILKMSVSDIKYHNEGPFFSRSTMRFFGDKMTSFGVRTFDGKRVLYRKPNAMVNVFGTWKRAGREFASCWIIERVSDEAVDITPVNSEFKERFFNSL